MKHRYNRLAVALALAGMIASATPVFTIAAERQISGTTIQRAPAAPSAPPFAGKTQALPGPIQLTPSKVKKLSKPEPPPVAFKEVEDAFHAAKYAGFESTLAYMKGHSKSCSTKAYSAQDQQVAGCKSSDTVEQCMEKLYDSCMSKCCPTKKNFQTLTEKELAASRKLAKRAQDFADYVEHMLNTYGK